jgi:hypothetical protein
LTGKADHKRELGKSSNILKGSGHGLSFSRFSATEP